MISYEEVTTNSLQFTEGVVSASSSVVVVAVVTVVTVVTVVVVVVVVEPRTFRLSLKILYKESERKIVENVFCVNSDDFLYQWSMAD